MIGRNMDDQHTYERICKDRFERLESVQGDIAKDTAAIREKVFNGYGVAMDRLSEELKSLRGWILGLIATTGVAVLATIIKMFWFT